MTRLSIQQNGRVREHRANGQYAPKPVMHVKACASCGCIVCKEVTPRYVNGFIDPRSMRPEFPDTCKRCGGQTNWESAFNQFMMEG